MDTKQKLLWIDKRILLENNNYIGMFDISKGVLMILIMLSHAFDHSGSLQVYINRQNDMVQLLSSPLSILQYGFIPALFMICGYGIRKQSAKKCISQTLGILWKPYAGIVFVVTLGTILKWMINGGSILARLRYQVLPFFLGYHAGNRFFGSFINGIGPSWFVVTYALGYIYLNYVLHEKKRWIQMVILGAGSIMAISLSEIPLPFCIQQVFICSGFMYVGIWLKKNKIPQGKLPIYLLVAVYFLCTFGCIRGGFVEFSINAFNRGANDVLTAYIAGVVLVCLLYRLNVFQGRLADGLRWIGRHMVWFCMVHTVSHVLLPWKKIAQYFAPYYFAGVLFEFFISFLYALLVCILLEKALRKYAPKNYLKT